MGEHKYRMIIRKSLEQSKSNHQKSGEHRVLKGNEIVGKWKVGSLKMETPRDFSRTSETRSKKKDGNPRRQYIP